MKLLGALFLTLSSVTPAASVFVIAPGVLQQAGTGALISFTIGAVISLFMAMVYAELSSAFPLTGGEYTIVGRLLGPFYGFIVLGVNFCTLLLIASSVSVGIGTYLDAFLPHVPPSVAGIACIIIATLCGILNIRTNAFVTGMFLVIEMLALITLAILGFTHISHPLSDFLVNPMHLVDGQMQPVTAGMMGLATVVAIFAYNGYGNAVYLGEEMHEAPRHIGRTIMIALLITIVAEMVPVAAVLMGTSDLQALLTSNSMFSDFVTARGGSLLNTFVSLGIALAIINANIAFLVMVARQLFSSGRDHVWSRGVNHALVKVHNYFHSPWVATLVCGGLSALGCLIPLNFLLVLTGTGIIVIYAAICVAVIVGRKNGKTRHGHYRMRYFPWPPVLALLALLYTIYANYLDPDVGRPSLIATVGMIVVAVLYYRVVLRRRGAWVLHDPKEE
jgi:amino acid transporter